LPEIERNIKAVLFDLDGTLVEFRFNVKESRIAMIDWLSKNSFDTSTLSAETKTQRIFDEVNNQCKNRNKDFAEVRKKLSQILETFEYSAFKEANPYPGSLGLLKKLRTSNIASAIVTNSGRGPVSYILRRTGFLPYLSLVVSREDMEQLKPEPEGLLRALQVLHFSPEDAIYVGDSTIDIDAAKKAGVPSVAICAGMYKADVLLQHSPDYLIERIGDAESLIFKEHI
jgi:HAD superfamily hydrolase (TIGR01509 family)